MNFGFNELRNLVINRGLCTVCGTCIGICPNECLELNYQEEEPLPELRGECTSCGLCYRACPGIDIPMMDLEKFCFGKIRTDKHGDLGIFNFNGMGYATDEKMRHSGASGGVATALLTYGLEKGLIDCAIVAGFSESRPWRTEAKIATTSKELAESAQSKYAAVAINSLLNEAVKRDYQRIAIIGCPCHIHAIRKIEYQKLAPKITKKIAILIGLFCGTNFHFEGTRHVLYENCNIPELEYITRLQYRGRGSDGSSKFVAELKNGERKEVPKTDAVVMRMNNFTRDRCMMCIDWSAELSDISIADYWGPVKPDEGGYSSILIRTGKGTDWIQEAQKSGYIIVKESPTDYLINSLGFENKKHGNVFRLMKRQQYGWPTPNYHYYSSYSPLQSENTKLPSND